MTLRLACLLAPGPKTVEHALLAESLCGPGMIARGDAFDHGPDSLMHFRKQWRERGIIAEQREERRLVGDEASQEVGPLAGQP